MSGRTNQRKFFRIVFKQPMLAELKILDSMELDSDQKHGKCAIADISAGGARFYAAAPLPELNDLLVQLNFQALGRTYRPYGTIARTILPEPGHYEYGVQFTVGDAETSAFIHLLNTLSIKLRKTDAPSGCSFCTDEDLLDFEPLRSGRS